MPYICIANDINNETNHKKYIIINKENSIKALQGYATGLAAQSLSHKVQGKVFAAQGFTKLGQKYAEHATEEMEWVDKFDLEISRREVPVLQQLTVSLSDDFATYDLLRGYALDEEEDWGWSEQQLELIEKIGLQNWLIRQL